MPLPFLHKLPLPSYGSPSVVDIHTAYSQGEYLGCGHRSNAVDVSTSEHEFVAEIVEFAYPRTDRTQTAADTRANRVLEYEQGAQVGVRVFGALNE